MYSYTTKIIYWQLLLWGVHIGHSIKNSIIFSSWLIYTYRQNILIINLFKTIWLLKNGYTALTAAINLLGPIWFINLNKNIELFTKYAAKQAGEFSYTCFWIHGMISNWITFGTTFHKLARLISTSSKKQFSKLNWAWHPWLDSRISWPRTTFISSVSSSPWATKECLTTGIPCIGIIDTNISGHLANLAIPGNDDSLDSLIFYNIHIAQYILEKKFSGTIKWFLNIKRQKRLIKFIEWVYINYIKENSKFNWIKLNKLGNDNNKTKNYQNFMKNEKIKISKFWNFGLKFYFSQNFGLNNTKEQVDIFESKNIKSNIELILIKLKKNSIFFIKLLNIFFIRTIWKNKNFLKKNLFKHKVLKLKFLTGFYNFLSKNWRGTNNYFYQRFLTGRIYKTFLRKNKWRFNKFVLHFIKFYYLKQFNLFRGWFSNYSLNLIKNSSIFYVSTILNSNFFKDDNFGNLKVYNNYYDINLKKKFIKYVYKNKLLNEKFNVLLKKVLRSQYINKIKKIYIFYKNYYYKSFYEKKINNFYISYLFFFNFYLWNNTIKKAEKCNNLLKIRKNQLNCKNYINNQFLQSAKFIKITKKFYIIKSNINFFKILKVFKKINIWFYNIKFFIVNVNYIIQNQKKTRFINNKTLHYNNKINIWDKQKKFLYIKNNFWFFNIKDKILWFLYKPYIINKHIKSMIFKKVLILNKLYKNFNKYNNCNNFIELNKMDTQINYIYLNFYKYAFNKNIKINYYYKLFKNTKIKDNLNFYKVNNLKNLTKMNFNIKKNIYINFNLNNCIDIYNWKYNKFYYKYIINVNVKKNLKDITYLNILIIYIHKILTKTFW